MSGRFQLSATEPLALSLPGSSAQADSQKVHMQISCVIRKKAAVAHLVKSYACPVYLSLQCMASSPSIHRNANSS